MTKYRFSAKEQREVARESVWEASCALAANDVFATFVAWKQAIAGAMRAKAMMPGEMWLAD